MTQVNYTPETITTALVEIVAHGGVATRAGEALADKGIQIPPETLRRWKNETHTEQYRRLELIYSREAEDAIVAAARDNALTAAKATTLAIEKTVDGLKANTIRDPARAAADLAKVTGASVQEVLRLTGRPTDISEHRDLAGLVMGLIDKGILQPADPNYIDGHATEEAK